MYACRMYLEQRRVHCSEELVCRVEVAQRVLV